MADKVGLIDHANRLDYELPICPPLSYQMLISYIQSTADYLSGFNFDEGDIIAVQLPATGELPAILLGIIHAGLVPCVMRPTWRRKELEQSLTQISPKAFINAATADNPQNTKMLFETAATIESIRFIFSISDHLEDGLTPFPNLTNYSNGNFETNAIASHNRSENHAALINWSYAKNGQLIPVCHTHKSLVANAAALIETLAERKLSNILTTISLTNLSAIVAGFIPWVLSSGTLHLTNSINNDELAGTINANQIDLAIIPASFAMGLQENLGASGSEETPYPHLCLTAPLIGELEQNLNQTEAPKTYLFNLNGLCIDTATKTFEPGRYKHSIAINGAKPMAARLKGALQKNEVSNENLLGELEISGPIVGHALHSSETLSTPFSEDDQNWQPTNLKAAIKDEAMSFITIDDDNDSVHCGTQLFDAIELDELYQSYKGFLDAAALAVYDPLLGERLYAAIIPETNSEISYNDFKQHLLSLHISPAKIPEKLIKVSKIPRDDAGLVQRRTILAS